MTDWLYWQIILMEMRGIINPQHCTITTPFIYDIFFSPPRDTEYMGFRVIYSIIKDKKIKSTQAQTFKYYHYPKP
jgi:hypothetical protein